MGQTSNVVPQIGMDATIIVWTDRIKATIVGIEPDRALIQENTAVRTDPRGHSDIQDYRYERNLNGKVHVFSRRRDGSWVEASAQLGKGRRPFLGARDSFRDASFWPNKTAL